MSNERQIVSLAKYRRMTPPERTKALNEGRLNFLLAGSYIEKKGLTLSQWKTIISQMAPDEILQAEKDGLLEPLAELAGEKPTPPASADMGARGTPAIGSREWLRTASPADIRAATARGDLDSLLAGEPRP